MVRKTKKASRKSGAKKSKAKKVLVIGFKSIAAKKTSPKKRKR